MKNKTAVEILVRSCEAFNIQTTDLTTKNNKPQISEIRHLIAYLMVTHSNMKIKFIARLLCRDRTTIINSVKLIKNLISINDKTIKQKIQTIENFTNHTFQDNK